MLTTEGGQEYLREGGDIHIYLSEEKVKRGEKKKRQASSRSQPRGKKKGGKEVSL